MANKHDLKIVSADLNGVDVVNVISAVPAGKTRFICMVKLGLADNAGDPNGVSIIDGELVTSDTTVVDHTHVDAAVGIFTVAFPDAVDVDNPFFSLAAGRFLNIKGFHAGGAGTVEFVYFDE